MNVKNVLNGIINFAGPTGLKVQKLAPEIFLGIGILGIITSSVLACRATLKKVGPIMDEHKKDVEMIHLAKTKDEIYSEKHSKKDLTLTYIKTGGAFLKVYGPAIAIMSLSLGAIIKGHSIMKGRNLALVAAYKGIQEAFKAYRKRVVEEHGEKIDYMYKNGLRAVEVVKPAYTDENGKKHKEELTTVTMADENGLSAYARYFDSTSTQFSPVKDYNYFFLMAQQNYFNDILKRRKHVFLNEVYDALGMQRTQAGTIVGWIYGGSGDNFIDFGVFDKESQTYLPISANVFVDGSILLDFNVDAVIYDDFTDVKV